VTGIHDVNRAEGTPTWTYPLPMNAIRLSANLPKASRNAGNSDLGNPTPTR